MLSDEERSRWVKHAHEFTEKSHRRRGEGYGMSSVRRDREDVRMVAPAIGSLLCSQFMYKNITRKVSLSRHDGVCSLNALIEAGFVKVLFFRNHRRVYLRLFGKDDVDRVVRVVCG